MNTKFLFVINSLNPGGAERSLVELLPYLRKRGIDCVVVCLKEHPLGLEGLLLNDGFDVRLLNSKGFVGRVRELRSVIRSEAPSLVHTVLFDADISGRLASAGTGIPVITTVANTSYQPERISADVNVNPLKLAAVRVVDGFTARHLTTAFHAVSGAVKTAAIESLKVDPGRVTVVHRGRDPSRLGTRTPERSARARASIGIGPSIPMVLTVGRQEFQKGHRFLVEAFAQVVKSHPEAVLVVAGRSGNASEYLTGQVERLGLNQQAFFLGHRDDVPDLLAAADIFVFPSLWEGLGGALIEALALEAPIVASDLPALREVIGDGEFGLLVPPGDSEAIARRIGELISEPEKRAAIVKGSRARFERDFVASVNNARLVDLLESVAHG